MTDGGRHELVRPGTAADAAGAAELHVATIADGFLPRLGTRFLTRLYTRVAGSPHAFLLVAPADHPEGTPLAGFVAGATAVGRLYREFLRRDGVRAAAAAAPAVLRHAPSVIETLRYGRQPAGRQHTPRAGEAELLAVGVDRSWRRKGLGSALVAAFLDRAAAAGATSARVVVGASNVNAVALYERNGFTPAGEVEVHRGQRSLVLRADLPGR